jgi:hypothetical protein
MKTFINRLNLMEQRHKRVIIWTGIILWIIVLNVLLAHSGNPFRTPQPLDCLAP